MRPRHGRGGASVSFAARVTTICREVNGDPEVGDIVWTGLHEVGQTKVDGKNITGVVVELL